MASGKIMLFCFVVVCQNADKSQAQGVSNGQEDFLLVVLNSGPSWGIYRIEPGWGNAIRLPLPTGDVIQAVAYDSATQTVFWSDIYNNGYRIAEAKIDGTGYRFLASGGSTRSMLYDAESDRLLYSIGGSQLHSLSRNTGQSVTLFSAWYETQLALDTRNSLLYFIDSSARQVMQHSINGTGSKMLFKASGVLYGLSVTTSGDVIYAGSYSGVLYRYSLGSGVLTSYTLPSGNHVFRLGVSLQHVYVLDSWNDVVMRAPLADLGAWKKVLELPNSSLHDMTLVSAKPHDATTTVPTAPVTVVTTHPTSTVKPNTDSTTKAGAKICTETDFSPFCPRMAKEGKCPQPDVIKFCRKSCLC